jgi:hypothetical protein
VENSVESITKAVTTMQTELSRYQGEAADLRARKEQRWERNKQSLIARIAKAHGSHAER